MGGSWQQQLARREAGETATHLGRDESKEQFAERTGTAFGSAAAPGVGPGNEEFAAFQAWKASASAAELAAFADFRASQGPPVDEADLPPAPEGVGDTSAFVKPESPPPGSAGS